jgi:hypothetical protein
MRIHARESEVLEWRRTKSGENDARRRRRIEVATAHTIEQILELGAGHRSLGRLDG